MAAWCPRSPVESVDLSEVEISGFRVQDLSARDVWMVGGRIGRIEVENCVISDSYFERCSFGSVEDAEGLEFRNCVFKKCRGSSIAGWASRIDSCEFRDMNLRGLGEWGGLLITNTSFSGKVTSAYLTPVRGGKNLQGCNLSRATLVRCEFPGVDMRVATLPDATRPYVIDDWNTRKQGLLHVAQEIMRVHDDPVARQAAWLILDADKVDRKMTLEGGNVSDRGSRYAHEVDPAGPTDRAVLPAVTEVFLEAGLLEESVCPTSLHLTGDVND